jgi:hypothetical protein
LLLLLLLCERALAFILLQREIAAAAAALTELVSKFCCAIAPRWARIFYLIGFGVSPCVARGVGVSMAAVFFSSHASLGASLQFSRKVSESSPVFAEVLD